MSEINGGFPPIKYIKNEESNIQKERFFSDKPFKMVSIKSILTSSKPKKILNVEDDIDVVDDF